MRGRPTIISEDLRVADDLRRLVTTNPEDRELLLHASSTIYRLCAILSEVRMAVRGIEKTTTTGETKWEKGDTTR